MELIVPQSIKEMERLAMEDPVWYATLKEEWYREVTAEEESGGKVVSFLLLIWTKIPIKRKFLLQPVCVRADKSDATDKFLHSPQA